MKSLGKQIVVIDNGFVHVGNCSIKDGFLLIENCQNIRVWGTSRGLGELVNGPLKSTVFDPVGTSLVPLSRIVFFVAVSGGWV